MLLAAISLLGIIAPAHAGSGDNYPSPWRSDPIGSYNDSWGYSIRNCTSWAAWALHDRNGFEAPPGMGNAANWGLWAKNPSHSYPVNGTPAVGAIAWWAAYTLDQGWNVGQYGHVAWVSAVSGSTVTVQEYNYLGQGTWHTRTMNASNAQYIHFKDIQSLPSGVWGGVGNASFTGTETIYNGATLQSNQYIMSPNGRYVLMMQTDGNLVAYGWGHSIWASNTSGNAGAYLGMQSDGNIVIYATDGHPVWSTGTNAAQSLVMQDDGNIVAYSTSGQKQWASDTVIGGNDIAYKGSYELPNGATLTTKQYIRSADKRYFTLMQDDGNMVVYAPGYRVIWASNTSGNAGAYLGVQSDGNVVIYRPGGQPVWSTSTNNISKMVIQTDGNFVGYSAGGQAPWASNTSGRL